MWISQASVRMISVVIINMIKLKVTVTLTETVVTMMREVIVLIMMMRELSTRLGDSLQLDDD